jgi:hypothetical protein
MYEMADVVESVTKFIEVLRAVEKVVAQVKVWPDRDPDATCQIPRYVLHTRLNLFQALQ